MENVQGMLLFTLLLIIVGYVSQLRHDIVALRKTVDRIARHVGVPDVLNDAQRVELRDLAKTGSKVKAVKRLRELTGLGLSEANDYVEALCKEEAGGIVGKND